MGIGDASDLFGGSTRFWQATGSFVIRRRALALGLMGEMRTFECPLCGVMTDSAIFAQAIAWKHLDLGYSLVNLEAAVATTFVRGQGVFLVVRVWILLSAVLECLIVGAGLFLFVVGLVFVFHLGTVVLLWPSSLRGCCTGGNIEALLGIIQVTLRSIASIVVLFAFLSIEGKWGLLKTVWPLKDPSMKDLSIS